MFRCYFILPFLPAHTPALTECNSIHLKIQIIRFRTSNWTAATDNVHCEFVAFANCKHLFARRTIDKSTLSKCSSKYCRQIELHESERCCFQLSRRNVMDYCRNFDRAKTEMRPNAPDQSARKHFIIFVCHFPVSVSFRSSQRYSINCRLTICYNFCV